VRCPESFEPILPYCGVGGRVDDDRHSARRALLTPSRWPRGTVDMLQCRREAFEELTAPSAANIGSRRATCLTSLTAPSRAGLRAGTSSRKRGASSALEPPPVAGNGCTGWAHIAWPRWADVRVFNSGGGDEDHLHQIAGAEPPATTRPGAPGARTLARRSLVGTNSPWAALPKRSLSLGCSPTG